jgi:hypothetical protein
LRQFICAKHDDSRISINDRTELVELLDKPIVTETDIKSIIVDDYAELFVEFLDPIMKEEPPKTMRELQNRILGVSTQCDDPMPAPMGHGGEEEELRDGGGAPEDSSSDSDGPVSMEEDAPSSDGPVPSLGDRMEEDAPSSDGPVSMEAPSGGEWPHISPPLQYVSFVHSANLVELSAKIRLFLAKHDKLLAEYSQSVQLLPMDFKSNALYTLYKHLEHMAKKPVPVKMPERKPIRDIDDLNTYDPYWLFYADSRLADAYTLWFHPLLVRLKEEGETFVEPRVEAWPRIPADAKYATFDADETPFTELDREIRAKLEPYTKFYKIYNKAVKGVSPDFKSDALFTLYKHLQRIPQKPKKNPHRPCLPVDDLNEFASRANSPYWLFYDDKSETLAHAYPLWFKPLTDQIKTESNPTRVQFPDNWEKPVPPSTYTLFKAPIDWEETAVDVSSLPSYAQDEYKAAIALLYKANDEIRDLLYTLSRHVKNIDASKPSTKHRGEYGVVDVFYWYFPGPQTKNLKKADAYSMWFHPLLGTINNAVTHLFKANFAQDVKHAIEVEVDYCEKVGFDVIAKLRVSLQAPEAAVLGSAKNIVDILKEFQRPEKMPSEAHEIASQWFSDPRDITKATERLEQFEEKTTISLSSVFLPVHGDFKGKADRFSDTLGDPIDFRVEPRAMRAQIKTVNNNIENASSGWLDAARKLTERVVT